MTGRITGFIFCFGMFLFSCKLEPCKDYHCVNGQALEDGKNCICLCDLGWDGNDCTVEDKCVTHHVVCYNGGYCTGNTGLCTCTSGYEGDSCQTLSREKFLESSGDSASLWDATDTCGTLVYQYTIRMEPGSDNRTLEIYNIRALSVSNFITANVSKMNLDQRNDVVIGLVEIRDLHGTLSSNFNTVRVTYQSDEGVTSNCKGNWNRQ